MVKQTVGLIYQVLNTSIKTVVFLPFPSHHNLVVSPHLFVTRTINNSPNNIIISFFSVGSLVN